MRRAVLLAASATLAALSIVAGASAYDGLFAPNSYRNAALPSNAPIDPFSRIYVNDLTSKVSRLGVYVNTTVFSTPVYTAAEGAPSITVDSTGGPGQPADWPGVPLSSSAQPAAGTDKWLTVYQPNSAGGTVWEFWHYDPNGGQPLADSGGRIDDVANNPGYFTGSAGATASGIPLLVGLQRIGELQAGWIGHAVSLAVNSPGIGFRWPAQRSDGTNPAFGAVQEGMRFRFPASLDISALHLPRYAAVLAKAIQRYGMVVTDTTGPSVGATFFAEDPTPTGGDPYTGPGGIFSGLPPNEDGQFAHFPWSKLQLLR